MLEGKVIQLRCVKEEDLSKLYFFFDSIRMKGEYLAADLLSEHQFRLSFYETGFWGQEKGTLLLVRKETVIGAIWFERRALFDCLDLHFYIFAKANRGKGFMSDALSLFSAYLFSTQKIERLQIAVPEYSTSAIRLAQKCGYQFEGIARSALFHRGKYSDLCIYSQIRSECKDIEKIYD